MRSRGPGRDRPRWENDRRTAKNGGVSKMLTRSKKRGDARHSERSTQCGYALVEMLIAAAISGVLLGVLFHFAVSVQTVVAVQGNVADVQQRLRVAVESVRQDLLRAGAGPAHGAANGPLARTFPPIVPARLGLVGTDPELSFYDDRITLLYVPETGRQTAVVTAMVDAAAPIAIDGSAPGCTPGRACDFAVGDHAVIFEPAGAGSAHETFSIAAVDTAWSTVMPAVPLSRTYPAGSRLALIVQRTYHFDRSGKRLMVYDGQRSDVPLVDHVVDVRFQYFGDPRPEAVPPPTAGTSNCAYAGSPPVALLIHLGGITPKLLRDSHLTDGPVCGAAPNQFDADLLRIRRVVLTVRLETESAEFRGGGSAFSSPGFSRGGAKYVPDLQTTIEVAPRNMAASW
jgi:prepilin-type N-terminal cleavage/methylation domain-containing protein